MAKPLRKKHLAKLQAQLENVTDAVVAIRRELEVQRLDPPIEPELERVETLLQGVKVGLERMGGTQMPALQAQLSELRLELGEHRRTMVALDRCSLPDPEPEPEPVKEPKRRGRPKKKTQLELEVSSQDVASHNATSEIGQAKEPDTAVPA